MERTRLLRVVDANLNRAREALRSLEEVFRMVRDDAGLFARVKKLRHGLKAYEEALGLRSGELAAARDPEGDVGRADPSAPYPNLDAFATANARRLEEALRVLEEMGRLLGKGSPIAAHTRFEAYALEKLTVPGLHLRARLGSARLYFVLNADGPGIDPLRLARAALRGGVDVIQLRAFPGTDRALLDLAHRLREGVRERDALFIINNRPDVALASDADGVHVGQDDLSVAQARRIVGGARLVGLSTHTVEEMDAASGADYLGIGAVYPTAVKPDRPALGPEAVASLFARSPVPAFPIGGIGEGNLEPLLTRGVGRVAVGAAIGEAEDPEQAARRLKSALEERPGNRFEESCHGSRPGE
ncbi:MAG: thiamine phosphate synthase [Planctomycetota bacterium]